MSISLITTPNNYELFCGNFTVSNEIACNKINTTETSITSLGLYRNDDTYMNVSVTLKYNYTGVVTMFYDSNTATSPALSNTTYFQLGTGSGQYDITGFPEIRGANGISYNGIMFISLGGVITPIRMDITKVSATQMNVKFYPLAGGPFANSTVAMIPFTFDYISAE